MSKITPAELMLPNVTRRLILGAMFVLIASTIGTSCWLLWPEIKLRLLMRDLSSADPDVRFHAAWTMSAFGYRAESAVPKLRELLEDDDELVRTAAAASLVENGFDRDPADTVLLQSLSAYPPVYFIGCGGVRSSGFTPRELAEATVRLLGVGAAPLLCKALRHSNAFVRAWGVWFLINDYCPATAEVEVDLRRAIHDEDSLVRITAAAVLANSGYSAEELYSVVRSSLNEANSNLAVPRALLLDCLGPSALRCLLRALRDPAARVRANAAERIGLINRPSPFPIQKGVTPASAVISGLTETLEDEDKFVRLQAASALAEFEGGAAPAAAVLIELLGDTEFDQTDRSICERPVEYDFTPGWTPRASAASKLGEIGPVIDAILPALLKAMHDENEWVRTNAIEGLGRMNVDLGTFVPALTAALSDEASSVRQAAANVLGGLASFQQPTFLIDTQGPRPRQ